MKIVVFQENLLKQLSLVSKFLPTKTATLPILSNILLTAEKGEISLSANNIESSITVSLPGKIEKEGKTLLPAKTFVSLVSSLSGEKVEVSLNEKQLILKGTQSEVALATSSAEDFPVVKEEEKGISIRFEKEKIIEIVERVAFASSTDPSRALLGGVLLEGEKGQMAAVSTDGFRMAKLSWKGEKEQRVERIVLSSRFFEALSSIVKERQEKEASLVIAKNNQSLSFSLPGLRLVTQVVEGTFPEYERIIPKETSTKVVLNREEMLREVRFISVLAREASNIIRLSISEKKIEMSANAAQTGKTKTTLSASLEGEAVEIAFNYRFLLDFLSSSEEDEVVFETSGSLSPGLFRFSKNQNYLYVVMPVRLQES